MVMFSSAVLCWNRLKCWKTMPTPWRNRLRSVLGSVNSTPSMTMEPLSTGSKPLSARRNVLLPEPLGPITTRTSPLSTWLVTCWSAWIGGRPGISKVLQISFTTTMGVSLCIVTPRPYVG
jgi:hypothetical protein